MSRMVELTVPMPARLASLRFPKALNNRLHHLLNEQGRQGHLSPAEQKKAEALAKIAATLSILKLGARVKRALSPASGAERPEPAESICTKDRSWIGSLRSQISTQDHSMESIRQSISEDRKNRGM